jgi:hypothetical protein
MVVRAYGGLRKGRDDTNSKVTQVDLLNKVHIPR